MTAYACQHVHDGVPTTTVWDDEDAALTEGDRLIRAGMPSVVFAVGDVEA